jgi:hypothetical protein
MTYEFQEYPKWVGDVVVNSRAEEDALHKEKVPVQPAPAPTKRTRKAKE